MAGYYEALGLLKQAQTAMGQADQQIHVICREREPGDVMALVDTALQVKACLASQMPALERGAPQVSGALHYDR